MVLGFLVRLSVAWSLGFAVLGAGSSWGSHAHPLASCFVSLALLVSRISSVYLSKVAQFELLGSGAWALGLFVSQFLGPRAHPLVWYFFSLVLVVSLVVISLVVISFVVSCLRTVATSTCNTSREISPKQRACTSARRARRERSGKHAARVHATASRATPCRQAANTRLSKQHRANVHVYMLCVCNMSITSETCRRSACVSSVLYRSVHVCEAL